MDEAGQTSQNSNLNQSPSGALYGNSVALHGIEIYLPLSLMLCPCNPENYSQIATHTLESSAIMHACNV